MISKNLNGEVWIFAEQEDGILSDIPFELLGKGRELADKLGAKLGAVLAGSNVIGLIPELIAHGADTVHLIDDDKLAVYQTTAYATAIENAIRECQPQICFFGATAIGRELAPTLASALRCGLTADCTDLQIGTYNDPITKEVFDNVLLQVRPAFGGNIIATIVNPRNWPQMATVREGVMKRATRDPHRNGTIVRHDSGLANLTLPTEILNIIRKAKSVNLKGARIIVAGGAGVGSRDNFRMIEELAAALGGAVGGSRAACDLGYVGPDHQIGQTGTTVRPALYIACGISGAVQHIAGMSDSAKILAINTDRDAPIFKIANYGIVGDVKIVIPKILKAIRGL